MAYFRSIGSEKPLLAIEIMRFLVITAGGRWLIGTYGILGAIIVRMVYRFLAMGIFILWPKMPGKWNSAILRKKG